MSRQPWSEGDLSAYVDGRLSPERMAALEHDLARDAHLRREVDELRRVVALMQSMPLREPPRNFLLTPAMVAPARPVRSRPGGIGLIFLRLSTALSALAFAFVMVLRFMPGQNALMVPGTASAPAAEVAMQVNTPTMAGDGWTHDEMSNAALVSTPEMPVLARGAYSETEAADASMDLYMNAVPSGTAPPLVAPVAGGLAFPDRTATPEPLLGYNGTEGAGGLGGGGEATGYGRMLTGTTELAEYRFQSTSPTAKMAGTPTPLPQIGAVEAEGAWEAYDSARDQGQVSASTLWLLDWLAPLFGGMTVLLGILTFWFSRRQG